MTTMNIACSTCKRFRINVKHRNCCDAFPDGIPDEIANGDNDHTQPFKGDHGLQYAAATSETDFSKKTSDISA